MASNYKNPNYTFLESTKLLSILIALEQIEGKFIISTSIADTSASPH
jgi:hypothetical protein